MNSLASGTLKFTLYSLLTWPLLGVVAGSGMAANASSDSVESPAFVGAGAEAGTVDGSHRLLDWKDLVSPTWEPPLILPAPDDDGHVVIDPASLVSALDNTPVKLPGYMVPIKYTGNEVTEFLLIPFLEHHVPLHMHHEANQMVYVSLTNPLPVANPYEPFWVEGVITLESVETDEGDTGYHLIDAAAYVYKY
jgi:hypothetical protein